MTFEETVVWYLNYYETPDEQLSKPENIQMVRELLEERYRMTAHRAVPYDKEKIFAKLVAIQLTLDKRASDLYKQANSTEPGSAPLSEVKSIQVGDTRTEFAVGATAAGGGRRLDQNQMLQGEFDSLWRSLIASTRRFLR